LSSAFPKKPAAFYPKARLLLKFTGGLLKFAARAFFEKYACFVVLLEKGLF
jgi:hypothetical protein